MDPGVVGVFIPILGIIGGIGFLTLKMWFNHQLKMRETPGGDIARLTEAMQQLHDEVGSMREDLTARGIGLNLKLGSVRFNVNLSREVASSRPPASAPLPPARQQAHRLQGGSLGRVNLLQPVVTAV